MIRKRHFTGRWFKGRWFHGRLFNGFVLTPGATVGGGAGGGFAGTGRVEGPSHYDDWRARQQDNELIELAVIITRTIT